MDEIRELLCDLIRIPSVNPMGRSVSGPPYYETRMTAYLEDWLRPLGVEVVRQPVAPGRDNLIAVYRAPKPKHHWLFEVHQDTVPAENMTVPPFEPTFDGDLVYGRGACDNKGPMTAMLLAFRRAVRERAACDLTLLLSVDEEFTFTGVSEFAKAHPKFDGAIVAEPTDLDVVVAHKGGARWEAQTKGVMCHSSAPERGVNAIYRMGWLLGSLERYAATLQHRPADPVLGKPTLSVGVIHGGVAVNIVPDACTIQVDRRLIPGESPATARQDCLTWVTRDLEAKHGTAVDFRFGDSWLNLPAMGTELNAALATRLLETVRPLKSTVKTKAEPYGSDAAELHRIGIPTVIFGPGSIAKAHTSDEFVPLSEIAAAEEILWRTIQEK